MIRHPKVQEISLEIASSEFVSSRVPKDPLSIDGIDYVEVLSANAKETVYYLSTAFGFTPTAYRGPETGNRDSASYLLQQEQIALLITSPLSPFHPYSHQLMIHGMTVKDIALKVPSCKSFYYEALKRGARSAHAPIVLKDEGGAVARASIHTYGDTLHSVIERDNYKGLFLPGFVPYSEIFPTLPVKPSGIYFTDHIVGNVELGRMEEWVTFYEKVLGFREMLHFSDKDISTEYSALMSKVVTDGGSKVKFPINEPAQGKRKSQIEEYLQFHYGAGVQHIALLTRDIISTMTTLRNNGVNFISIPPTYYESVTDRVGVIKEDLKTLAELGILIDRDEDGYLLQTFTRPIHDRPTLFFEIIQREGSSGFGIGNFKALFEAIERDQALRGNL